MYFQRAMSGRASDWKPDDRNAAATASVTSSTPAGHRPTSRMATACLVDACTTPGSRWVVGAITVTAWTDGQRRRKARSLATPFCRHTIGVSGRACSARASITPAVSCPLTPMMTTSSGPNVSSDGWATTGTGSVTESSGHSTVRPRSAMAAPWAPRATSTTSWPCWNIRPPTTPPTAPAP